LRDVLSTAGKSCVYLRRERDMSDDKERTCGCESCGCGESEGLKIEKKVVSEMDGVS